MTRTFTQLVPHPVLRPIGEATTSLGQPIGRILLILLLNFTTFDFVRENEGTNFATDWQTISRLAMCAACGFYGFMYLTNTIAHLFRFPGAWSTLICAWALITVPFSASPAYSAAAVFALVCVNLFAPAVLLQLGGRVTIETILTGLLIFVGLNWFFYFTYPTLARSAFEMPDGAVIYRFGNDAQQLALHIAWALGFLVTLAFAGLRSWRSTLLPVIVLIGTLPLTQSRTGAVTTLAASSLAIWFGLTHRQRQLAIAGAILLIVVAFIALAGGMTVDSGDVALSLSRSGNIEELKNFTGRTEIWEYVWELCFESPMLGCGYGAARFALHEDPSYPFDFQANHAHNLLLNVVLSLGFPGALLLAAMIVHQLVAVLRRPSPVPAIALAVITIAGITEPLLYGPMPRSHTIIWLIALFWQQMGMDLRQSSNVATAEV